MIYIIVYLAIMSIHLFFLVPHFFKELDSGKNLIKLAVKYAVISELILILGLCLCFVFGR